MIKATLRKPVTGKSETPTTTTTAAPAPKKEAATAPTKAIEVEASVESLCDEVNEGAVNGSGPAQEVEVTSETAAKEPPKTTWNKATAIAKREPQGHQSAVEGDVDDSDVRFPSLRIVNGSGKMSQMFNQGCVIFADELLFDTPKSGPNNSASLTPPLNFVPILLKKQFREVLTQEAQEDGEMPRIVDSKEEVEALGGRLIDFDGEQANWKPLARCLFLLEQPEGTDHPGFITPLDGKLYAPAVYYAGGMAYSRVFRTLNTGYSTVLKVPVLGEDGKPMLDERNRTMWRPMLHRFVWQFQVGKVVGKNFTTFQPSIRMTKIETGPDVRQFAEDIADSRDQAVIDGTVD